MSTVFELSYLCKLIVSKLIQRGTPGWCSLLKRSTPGFGLSQGLKVLRLSPAEPCVSLYAQQEVC